MPSSLSALDEVKNAQPGAFERVADLRGDLLFELSSLGAAIRRQIGDARIWRQGGGVDEMATAAHDGDERLFGALEVGR
jgi:hypothetical protein